MIAFWRCFLIYSILAFYVGMSSASAQQQVTHIEPQIKEGQLYIDADVTFEISSELRTAAEKGVPIYFVAELQIKSERWWWFDKTLVDAQLNWRLVYNVLTRQWRVGTGDLSLPQATLEDALSFIRSIRGWAVADIDEFDVDKQYQGRLRVRLDTSRLPRPFQIDAYNSSAWNMATPWKDFTFSISDAVRNPS